jgi:hypothetical protein
MLMLNAVALLAAHLVVHVEALDVTPVALNHINQVVNSAVLFEQQLQQQHASGSDAVAAAGRAC